MYHTTILTANVSESSRKTAALPNPGDLQSRRPMSSPYLIYGATGYTGALTARLAVDRGDKPVLRGPERAGPGCLAGELNLPFRAVRLDDPQALDRALRGMKAVLHCAGPLSATSPADGRRLPADEDPLPGHHREATRLRGPGRADAEARRGRGDALPGAGVRRRPVRLPGRPPEAPATDGQPAGPGLSAHRPALPRHGPDDAREHRPRRPGAKGRRAHTRAGGLEDAGDRLRRGPRTAITIPWGDVSTAYHSTGIPDIEVYMSAPLSLRVGLPGPCAFSARCSAPLPPRPS